MASENEDRETLADVVAEKRARANEIEGAAGRDSNQFQRELIRDLRAEADRIAAAAKRDEERAIEHATRHAEAVARDNCRDCVHNPKGKNYEGGNAAAMREALVKIHGIAKTFMDATRMRHVTDSARIDVGDIEYLANAALAAPLRNCDVGTAEEQDARFVTWRYSKPLRTEFGLDALAWAQMPYEAEEGDVK